MRVISEATAGSTAEASSPRAALCMSVARTLRRSMRGVTPQPLSTRQSHFKQRVPVPPGGLPPPPGRALKSFGADSQYTGETLNGSRYGRKSFSTGSQYTGELLNGSRHGRGTKRWPNGDMYEGEWYFDKKDGRGNLTETEASYEGEWRAGMKHGKGTVKFVGGGEYEGEWFSDR